MRRFQFAEDEYSKLSAVTGISMMDLQKLDALGLLVNDAAVRLIFQYEFRLQQKKTKAMSKLIIQAIANKYDLPPSTVRKVLFGRARRVFYCAKCQKEITKKEYNRNNELCDQCVIDNIKL